MSVLWFVCGYSLSFSETGNAFIGGLDKVFMQGITKASLWETIPEALWATYQCAHASYNRIAFFHASNFRAHPRTALAFRTSF